tara:strand:+ start:3208 stop:4356 length:1149 start_codon:yes stop_codon:yes gene_type:complete
MPTPRKLWGYDQRDKAWIGYFRSSEDPDKRASRRVIATYSECPEEDYDYLISRWEAVAARLQNKPRRPGLGDTRVKEALNLWYESIEDPRTLELYELTGRRFLKVTGNVKLEEISIRETLSYRRVLEKKGLAKATVHSQLRQLRAFFGFCVEAKLLEHRPFIKFPKVTQKDPRIYTEDELYSIIEKIVLSISNAKAHFRYRFHRLAQLRVFVVAMETGMRCSEIFYLRLQDIKLGDRSLLLREKKGFSIKGNREDGGIDISEALYKFLLEDLSSRGEHERWFCDNGRGDRAYKRSADVARAIKQHAKDIGMTEIPKPVHGIRATVCTRLLKNGINIVTVQGILRHKDVTTTRKYANSKSLENKKALDELQWRSSVDLPSKKK